jgi:uncharacterized OB-fold protein
MNVPASGFSVARCSRCGSLYFPRRLICRRCGGDTWTDERLLDAVIEESTAVAHVSGGGHGGPRILATVSAAGVHLVVGLETPLPDGARVLLFEQDGAPIARPVDPGSSDGSPGIDSV